MLWRWRGWMLFVTVGGLVVCACFLLQQPTPDMHRGRPVAEWVRQFMSDDSSMPEVADIVAFELKGRAVPHISRELRMLTTSHAYWTIYGWQQNLPIWLLRLASLPEPKPSNGAVGRAASVLSEMGEAARPAILDLAAAADAANMRAWERQEVMHSFIHMGPVAAAATPTLRRVARDSTDSFGVAAAIALYEIDGSTDLLRTALTARRNDPSLPLSTELWWYRNDDVIRWIMQDLGIRQAAKDDGNCSE